MCTTILLLARSGHFFCLGNAWQAFTKKGVVSSILMYEGTEYHPKCQTHFQKKDVVSSIGKPEEAEKRLKMPETENAQKTTLFRKWPFYRSETHILQIRVVGATRIYRCFAEAKHTKTRRPQKRAGTLLLRN